MDIGAIFLQIFGDLLGGLFVRGFAAHLAGGTPTSPMAAPLEKMGAGECVENRD